MALHLKLKPHSHHHSLRLLSSSSSSSPFPPPPPPPPSDESPPESQSQPNVSSYFRDIKQRYGSSPSLPHRIPTDPPPPSSLFPPQSRKPSASLDEIRKSLANFRRNPPPSSTPSSSTPSFSPPSFHDILKNNTQNNPPGSASDVSFDSIRQNLRQARSNDAFFNLKNLQESIRNQGPQTGAPRAPPLIGSDNQLPETIFGREAREREGEIGEKESKELTNQLIKSYTHLELGEKLVRLRAGGEKKEGFSLNELNKRLFKLRKWEEEETKMNDSPFSVIRQSLKNIQNSEDSKKRQQRMPILTSLGGLVTPTFMLKQPQEHLLEKYFHPDHMSSAEKMKMELKKVRGEFKMSESDCGSARVQVAQLTTKIKHLSTVLNQKDKHSKKGLQEMVQRRKKLLKYLRRTDWDSYCLVLSKLGLRDVPEYKAPDYKAFTQTKTKSKKCKSRSRSKGKAKIRA